MGSKCNEKVSPWGIHCTNGKIFTWYDVNMLQMYQAYMRALQLLCKLTAGFLVFILTQRRNSYMGPSKCCLARLRVFAVEEIDKANGFNGVWDGHCGCHMFFCLFSYTEYLYMDPNNQTGTQSHMVIELATLWTEHINLALAYCILINVGENKRIELLPFSSFKIHIINALQIPLKIWIIQLLQSNYVNWDRG